jgi:hypothetical protein
LGQSIGSISGGGKIDGIFALVKVSFLHGLRGIIEFLHALIVLNEVGGVDVPIGCV